MSLVITTYDPLKDEEALFRLLEMEGAEWQDYWSSEGKKNYRQALRHSHTYVLKEYDQLWGYVRCRDDDGFGTYIYDLLVDRSKRGNDYGRLLMEKVVQAYPEAPVYVMSDVDPYYEKLGYEKEGTIFIVTSQNKSVIEKD